MAKDYYSILGVPKDASDDVIKRAYRKLAQQYHPDRPGGDEKKFKEINEAYQILSDRERRRQYDQFGTTFEQAQTQGAGGFGGFEGFRDFSSFADAFKSAGGGGFNFGFEDIFGDIFGGAAGGGRRERRAGEDINIDVEITLEDVFKGVEKEIELYKRVVCPHCGGNGAEPGTKITECPTCKGSGQIHKTQRTILGNFTQIITCPTCHGEGKMPEKACKKCGGDGRIKDSRRIKIKIPAGIENEQVIVLSGEGEAALKGGAAGDLYIAVHVKPHNKFERQNSDLVYRLEIPVSMAVLGGEIEVPTIDGRVNLKIPSGTRSGKVLRLKGKGLPRFRHSGHGDELVEITIAVPEKLSRKQKELFDEIRKEGL